MNYRLPFILSLVFVLACSQIDAPREAPEPGSATTATSENQPNQTTGSVSRSTRQKYNKTYNLFKVHHRNVFDLINENKFALRNEGRKSVEAAETLLSLLSEEDQSQLEDAFDNYQQAWEGFDQRSPSVGERNRLKSAGEKIRRQFNPENVRLKTSQVTKSSQTENERDEQEQKRIERDTSSRTISVKNPTRYRELFSRWQRAHVQFQQGLENDDPLMKSTFSDLRSTIESMIAQVETGKDKLKNYYLSQYELIFSQQDQFSGTPAKSAHLSYLKQQFVRDFALSSE
jgi:hypothetical protein